MNNREKGKVYLVGAGPGDPSLITLRAVECLHCADVVIYDFLASPTLLNHADKKTEMIYVGKQAGDHTLKQEDIIKLIIEKAKQGLDVVRLKGGDPFVFGRGGEECLALKQEGIPFEVIPGITAGISVPCYAGIPVTHRKLASSVAFITGHEDPTKPDSSINWKHLAKGVDTLVFYMGVSNLPLITSELTANGLSGDTPVAVIRWGTKPSQQTITGTLDTIVDIAEKKMIKPPSIIIVGRVVSLSKDLAWFENRPLFGRRIINTRSRGQASMLSKSLTNLGAEVIELPTIEIVPEPENSDLKDKIKKIKDYDWLIFTSPNGVDAFFKKFLKRYNDIRELGNAKIACIGPGTSDAVKSYHIHVDITAKKAVAEGLIAELETADSWKNKRILLPRAKEARDVLPDTLSSWGAHVDLAVAYKTVKPADIRKSTLQDIVENRYDLITFSSSSTFKNFIDLFSKEKLPDVLHNIKAVSIGPITSSTMHDLNVKPLIEASEHTIPGLVRSIKEYFIK